MALTANTDYSLSGAELLRIPLLAAAAPYQGSAVGIDSSTGYARALVAGDAFLGFCQRRIEEPGTANGEAIADLHSGIFTGIVPLAGAAATDAGDALYMSDDGTFTKTSTSNSKVGTILGLVSTGQVRVRFVTADIALV